ncbi:hypothetical protein BDZ94DRAFT_294869 [Collybia nuda]|uniref:MYND-type domain-containing protein n=1 Tax=Collybia nuda TaxID=64659 RepID=A0A9P6C942_9AGAR|nr:hypothetical protein BDZ94DRAFT_1302228 [Collybia nuda]KAF9456922.1 hypothetical protein BDZ94DRAFT_294869 [Collybia nuda]
MLDLSLANTCDNCDKHLPQIHGSLDRTDCDRCLPDGTILRTCGGCHEVRYCGADCQRKNWKGHKEDCTQTKEIVELSEQHGPLVAAQRKRVLRWAKKNRDIFNAAASFAVGIGSNEDRSQTHSFLIMVKATKNSTEETPDNLFPLSVASADAVTDAEFQGLFPGKRTNFTKTLSKRPNHVKLIVYDADLPMGLGLVYMHLEAVDMPLIRQSIGNMTLNWKSWLHASLAAGKGLSLNDYLNPNDPGQKARHDTLTTWYTTHGEKFSMAAYSALNLKRGTNKQYTHALRVNVDARTSEGRVPFQFKVRSAEVVSFDKLGDGKPHTANQGFIHTIIVDDALPAIISASTIALDTRKYRVQGMYQHRDNWLQHLKKIVDQY